MKPLKIDTEWQLGTLAFIVNIISIMFIILTALIGFKVEEPRVDIIGWCLPFYVGSLITLLILWVDKFKYIED